MISALVNLPPRNAFDAIFDIRSEVSFFGVFAIVLPEQVETPGSISRNSEINSGPLAFARKLVYA